MFVLDTNVVSQLQRAAAGRADPAVVEWFKAQRSTDLFISAITLMELEIGILLLSRRDTRQGAVLREWFDTRLRPQFAERVLAIDNAVALRCAGLHVPDPKPERDALIGATALMHGFAMVTRNRRDFEHMGIEIVDPWVVTTPLN